MYKNIVPWGSFKVEYDFLEQIHPFFSVLRPSDRLGGIIEEGDEKYRIINFEPIYFDIETPRSFKDVLFQIDYKFPAWQNKDYDFKMGVMADKNGHFKLEPIENRKLEKLLNDWDTIREGNIILMQGVKKYASIEEVLNNLPNRNNFAVYNFNLNHDLILYNYQKQDGYLEVSHAIKGYHQFYTYIKNEPLNFDFNFMSRDEKFCVSTDASAEINVYYDNNLILNKAICDRDKFLTEMNIYEKNLKEGVYKVEVKITDDIYINKINTAQKFLSFINKVNFVSKNENFNDVKLYTDSESLKIASSIKEGLQEIQVGTSIYNINELFKQFIIEGYSFEDFEYYGQHNSLAKINLKRDNILIQGAGVFSFSEESFINPSVISLENMKNFSNLQYVIATYDSPENLEDGYRQGKLSFNLSSIPRDGRKYKFILSVPGVEELHIKRIKAEFR
ncbi:MAG: hypothetical protein V1770_00810 [bacterium]